MPEHIAVVGGGTGGTVLANRLTDELRAEIDAGAVEVTLVTERADQVYKPTFLYVAFGEQTPADARHPVADLIDTRRVDLRIDRVTGIDTGANHLDLRGDETGLDYDHLVVATGARLDPEAVPGLPEGGHHFYGADGATALRDALADFRSGHLVLSVIGVPHMCPAAPLEFVLMADDWLRERGRREDVDITYTYPIQRVHGIQSIADWASDVFAERDIEAETFVNPESVDPDDRTVHTMEGDAIDYDLLVAIPPHTGDPVIAESELGEDGWVPVDRHTLAAENASDVYAIGDAADVPTSKAGSVAHYEAGVVADRLAATVRGNPPTATYDGKTICFVETGMDEATFVEFGYGEEPTVREPSRTLHWGKLAYNETYWLTAKGVL
ncbi:MAG: NAD(P)/FAD-dependent oxidoreductase [Halobacteriaceae archaeon]